MKTPDKIKKGLRCCSIGKCETWHCPYDGLGNGIIACTGRLHQNALAYIQQLEREKFDVLFEISAAYYGKAMYGLNDDGTVYSRYSCDEMTFDEAVSEMAGLLYERYEQ